MVLKTCKKCNEELYLTQFASDKRSKDGLKHVCIDCSGESTRQEKRKPLKAAKKVVNKLKKQELSDYDKYLKILLTDFPKFLKYSYSCIGTNIPTPTQGRIAEILGTNPEEMILQAPRGVGKTWITAIYGAWRLYRNPDEKILIVSGTSGLAEDISKFMRIVLDSVPELSHMIPNDRDSVQKWTVANASPSKDNSVSAVGIGAQITGKRASLVIADDIEIPSNSATQLLREKLLKQAQEFSNILIPDAPTKSVIFLGTPQSMESIYSKLPYKRLIIPATVPDNLDVYDGYLDPWVLEQGPAGTPTDPVRFGLKVLEEKLSKIGPADYLLQYMQDTSLSDARKYPLKQKDLIITPLDKVMAPINISYGVGKAYLINELENLGFHGDYFHSPSFIDSRREQYDEIIMSIDPAGNGPDETTWAVIGVKNGTLFLLDIGGTHLGYSEEAIEILANKASEYNVNKIVPEANMGDGMFSRLLRPVLNRIHSCQIIDNFKVSGNKQKRIIDNIEPLITNHKLVVDYNLIEKDIAETKLNAQGENGTLVYSFLYQLTHSTLEKDCLLHDDRVDALALGVQYLKDFVILDADKKIKKQEEEEMQKWLHEKVYGTYTKTNRSFLGASKR